MNFTSKINKFVYNRTYLSLAFIFIATGIRSFWGLFFSCPTIIKVIFSGMIYLSLIIFPYNSIKQSKSDFNRTGYYLLILLILLLFFALNRGLLSDGSALPANKYISLFFNEYTLLLFFPPIFSFLAVKQDVWLYTKKLYINYLIYGLFCLIILKPNPIIMSVYLFPLFLPHFRGMNKLMIYFSILAILYVAIFIGDRKYFVLLFYGLLSYFTYINSFLNKLVRLISIASILVPLIILIYSIKVETSPFEIISELNIKNSFQEAKDISADSRTLLYTELALDLNETDSWLIGKGPIGSYYSSFMEAISNDPNAGWGDSSNRIQNEVTFLSYVLKGGLVYVVICVILLIVAILNAALNGKNRFVRSISVLLSGYFFNSFMGDMTGCSLFQILIWLFIGTCLSNKWINYSDKDIIEKLKLQN